jgi:hypothetical protein
MTVLVNGLKLMQVSRARFVPNIRQGLAGMAFGGALWDRNTGNNSTTCVHTDSARFVDLWRGSPGRKFEQHRFLPERELDAHLRPWDTA